MKTVKHVALLALITGFAGCADATAPKDHPLQRSHLALDRVVLQKGDDAPQATLRFLGEDRDALKLLKLRAPREELVLSREENDTLGMKHVRFQQVMRGIPVVGAELAAHYDAAGRVAAIDANYVPNLDDVDLEPRLEMAATRELAKATVSASPQATAENEKLVVFALGDREPRLAYTHTIKDFAGAPAIWIITVDAISGEILDRLDNLQTVEASGAGVKGEVKKFEVSAGTNGGFVMLDNSTGVTIRTLTAANKEVTPGQPVTSTTLTNWDRVSAGAGAAVDAQINAGITLKYYKERHQRNAIDGAGGELASTVHFGAAYPNAFWDGTGMTYGDGAAGERAYSVALDVVVHEISHGVTEKTSALRYEAQSGALNEAFSDIMSAYAEHIFLPDPKNNWLLGEDLTPAGTPFRDMMNPSTQKQPAAMSQYVNTQQDNGGVHINSGIVNHAAFLMTMGGTNAVTKVKVPFGLGWDKGEKVWYRANTKYFLATTNFAQAAQGTVQAAKDLLTPNEASIVECAWKAVGVLTGACATITDPNPPAADPKGTGATPGEATQKDESQTGSNTEIPSSGASDDGSADDEDEPVKPKKKKKVVTTTTSGCNAGGGSLGGDPLAVLLAVAYAASRRRRR